MKAKLEQRREDESLFQYVSPLLNPVVVVEPMMKNKTPVRFRSTFRARSVTNHARPKTAPEQKEAPIPSNGSRTTSNVLMRNSTPIRSRSRMRLMIPSTVSFRDTIPMRSNSVALSHGKRNKKNTLPNSRSFLKYSCSF